MKFKNNKGFTGVDVAVSLVILLVFVSFIAALFYNLANTSKRIERKAQATNIAIEVIEALKATPFEKLQNNPKLNETLNIETFNELTGKNLSIPNGYSVKYSIKNPNNSDGSESIEMGQVIKMLSVDVDYTLGNGTTETVKIETLVKNL